MAALRSPAAQAWCISFRDIASEHLPHLFDRFYRVEHSRSRTTGGSGLRLAITKHLVEAHHGTITVTSRPSHGSVFTIPLPTRS